MKLKTMVAAFCLLLSVCVTPLALAQDKDAKDGAKTPTAKTKHSAAWYKTHGKKKHSAAWYKTHGKKKHSAAWYKTHGKKKHSAAWYKTHGKTDSDKK